MKTIAIKKVKTRVSYEDTYGSSEAGQYMSIFELMEDDKGRYTVEWEIPALGEHEVIGIFCYARDNEDVGREKVVSDYDGVFSLPAEVVELLEENGFDCENIK